MESENGSKVCVIAHVENDDKRAFDPFAERKNEHPTTNRETLVHLVKASLGTGILAMPYVFKLSGLAMGVLVAVVTAFICAHCSYILPKCAHILYGRTRRTAMTFPEVAETAFATGPRGSRWLALPARYFVITNLFLTYFGSCTVYAVIVGDNAKQMYHFYTGHDINVRVCILIFLLPLILLTSIRNLKFLAPVSMIANLCMATGLGITVYYFGKNLPDISERPMVDDINGIPSAISITIFAIQAIGVVMPLENQMKTPQNYVGVFGVLNQGMTFVTCAYVIIGFLGYWSFGYGTNENITINLPVHEIPAQVVKIVVLCAVLFTFSLQMYVCIEIVQNAVKSRVSKSCASTANYIIRALLTVAAVGLAVAVPTMGPLITFIGAFGFSCLGLIAPVAIETVTRWDSGFGRLNWILIKNFICLAFGVFALIFGSRSAILGIIEAFF